VKFLIYKCATCNRYTLGEMHCGRDAKCAHPLKYSPDDRYARYRRIRKGLAEKTGVTDEE